MQILRERKEAQKHQPEKGAIYKPNEEKKHGTKGFRLSAISFRMTALCPLKSHLNKTSCTVTSKSGSTTNTRLKIPATVSFA